MIFTVGHSTRPLQECLELLAVHGIEQLVDVRTIPRSRRHPQYNTGALAESLQQAYIRYRHLPGLGGLRHPRKDSINSAWRNDSFRGYADYMQTPPFEASLLELIQASNLHRTVIMCAEAVPWRCHRSLIADALLARGLAVADILSTKPAQPHALTSFARIDGGKVTYPGLLP
ncbi:MAG: DUF488 domain-containing protein [Acidobacteriota bacterium]|nr:DUF488 domain-containing protein [Acidobacteriota bacterium]